MTNQIATQHIDPTAQVNVKSEDHLSHVVAQILKITTSTELGAPSPAATQAATWLYRARTALNLSRFEFTGLLGIANPTFYALLEDGWMGNGGQALSLLSPSIAILGQLPQELAVTYYEVVINCMFDECPENSNAIAALREELQRTPKWQTSR